MVWMPGLGRRSGSASRSRPSCGDDVVIFVVSVVGEIRDGCGDLRDWRDPVDEVGEGG